MQQAYFLTGTDTEVGKTFVTCALLHRARLLGHTAAGLKPIAAGTDAAGKNEDVEQIRAASTLALSEDIINPYRFRSAIAPHLAAAEEGVSIDFTRIQAACASARQQAEFLIVEGVGGFRVPLGVEGDSADLAVLLALPVILVVGMRLGCINHALLTSEAIASRHLPLAGWVANCIDPHMARLAENILTLKNLLKASLLGVVPFDPQRDSTVAADFLSLPGNAF